MITVVSAWPDRAHAWLQWVRERESGFFLNRFPLVPILIGAVALILILVVVWNWVLAFVSPRSADERISLLSTSAQIAGGMILLIGLYFTARTYVVNREGQITERFTRAIEHLGSKELAIRLGGIYALERIARDSPRDQRQIIEVLTTYVREMAPVSAERDESQVKSDVQAILTVIGRRDPSLRASEPAQIDLRSTNLRGAVLSKSFFDGANFAGADLEGANLREAHLQGAVFSGTHLEDSDCTQAHLERANLELAHMEQVRLLEAHLEGANLDRTNLEEAVLAEAHLEDADLFQTRLVGAYLRAAHFEGASLYGARLDRATLFGTHLERADLTLAHLSGAGLNDAFLEGAHLTQVHLEGANLTGVTGLTQAQIDETYMDENTTLPEGPGPGGKPYRRSIRVPDQMIAS